MKVNEKRMQEIEERRRVAPPAGVVRDALDGLTFSKTDSEFHVHATDDVRDLIDDLREARSTVVGAPTSAAVEEGVHVAAVEVLITLSDGQKLRLGTKPGDLIRTCNFENTAGLTLGPNVPASKVRRDGTRSLRLWLRWWEGTGRTRGTSGDE